MENITTKGKQVGISREGVHQKNKIDINGLETDLKKSLDGIVRFDNGALALYATDASNYRQIPIGVVTPKTEEDIIKTVAICHKHKTPIINRGGGTSLAGQGCNHAVVMDMSRYYNKVLQINKDDKWVSVQPGIVLDEMKIVTHKEANLTFGPDPATHNHCTIGGMLGNNSCGAHSLYPEFHGLGERTSDNVHSLTILTYDGVRMEVGPTSDEEYARIVKEGGKKAVIYQQLRALRDKHADKIREKFPDIPRRVSGYNLPDLLPENGFNIARTLVGSESTCVTIVEAKMMLLHKPNCKSLLVLGYPSIYDAGHAVIPILKHKPAALEGLDDILIHYMNKKGLNVQDLTLLPKGKGWLMVEFDGESKEDSDNRANKLMEELKKGKNPPDMKLYDDPAKEKLLWEVRESGLGATAWVPDEPMTVPGWEDTAVPPEKIGDYLQDLEKLFHKYNYHPSVYGHFGQGVIHCRIQFDLFTEEGLEKYRSFSDEIAHLIVSYGGSLSGEHGDGQARADELEIMYGSEIMQAFREFKAIWDPEWKMNPGKIVEPYGQFANLRFSNQFNMPHVDTHFKYPDDKHSFGQATMRCVGVGLCRREHGGTMCPSYMVTHEEEHSTRGRAHMLFEMMQGQTIKNGWKDEHVKNALDLCLACKGCKGDCPVNVDMATYKSEFLSHYYDGRLRPRTAYLFGWIYWWSRMASLAPTIANFFTQTPVLSTITKAVVGVAQQRQMPKFAPVTFKQWFNNRGGSKNKGKQKVILWADTFNNYYMPETLVAAVDVLEAAGFDVIVPQQSLCCGRPLYDFGMLDTAKKLLVQIMDTLKEDIEKGTPIVGLEPSCTSVFRDELHNLFPYDEDAMRLKQNVLTLAEFLNQKAPDFNIPKLKKKAIVHGHCHHKAIMKMDGEKQLLDKTGLDYDVLDSGCCGLAGYFGYEKGNHYEVSIKAGERVLLPAVRKATAETIIIADGFSCREQIEQETARKGMHLAQVLQMALHENNDEQTTTPPEKKYVDGKKLRGTPVTDKIAVAASIIGVAFAAYSITKKIMNSR